MLVQLGLGCLRAGWQLVRAARATASASSVRRWLRWQSLGLTFLEAISAGDAWWVAVTARINGCLVRSRGTVLGVTSRALSEGSTKGHGYEFYMGVRQARAAWKC